MESSRTNVAQEGRRDLAAIIFRNMLFASVGSWIGRISNFVFIIFAVRMLGEVDLGRYATIVAFAGLFSVFSELGMAQYVERSIAQDSSQVKDLFWNLIVLRILLALGGIVGMTTIAFGVYDTELALGVFVFSLTFLLSAFLVPLTVVLTANERFDLATGIHLIGQMLTVLLGITLLWAGLGIFALLLTGFIAMPLQIIAALLLVRRNHLGPTFFKLHPRRWLGFIRMSLPFGITSLALTLNFNVDTVILGFFRPDADVGWYNASYRLVFNAVSIVGAFLVVMTPSLAREHQLSPERVRAWVRTGLYWMIVFGLPAGAGLSLVATDTVRLLYGESFVPAGPVAAIIAWDIPLFVLLSFFGNVTAATGLERSAAKIYVASACANVILNLAFIPFYGMYAAAAITVVSDMITVVMFVVLLREMIVFHPRLSSAMARVGLATTVMIAVLLAARDLPLFPSIALGGAIYLTGAVLLRLIDLPTILGGVRRVVRRIRPGHSVTG